jgi:hypothetical protein
VEKNRDGKTGKTNLYFDYPRSRILTVKGESDVSKVDESEGEAK